MRILLIGGTFDEEGGKESGIINKMVKELEDTGLYFNCMNGGHLVNLRSIINSLYLRQYNVIMWFPNITNYISKIDIKSIHPYCILVTSKLNNNERYSFKELVVKSLDKKANLTIEFSQKEDSKYNMRLFDPLGNVWKDYTDNICAIVDSLLKRVDYLVGTTRLSTQTLHKVESKFIEIVRDKAAIFNELINPINSSRYLGNASTRCSLGFPSAKYSDVIYVSKRNIDKETIDEDSFVPVFQKGSSILVMSECKPSVDTPVQLELYSIFKDIKYMIHGHVYVKDAVFTDECIPCGCLEEVSSIYYTCIKHNIDTAKSFCINLRGHGSIVFATDLEYFKAVEYYARPIPEIVI